MTTNTINNIANVVLIASLILGVISTYTIVVTGNKKERQLRQELSQAKERAANAEWRAAEAHQKAAEAYKKAEEEKLARVLIEESIAWRRLSTEQQVSLESKLNFFSGQLVHVWYGAGDKEAETFAWEIAAVLKEADWQVFSPASMITLAESGNPFGTISSLETGVTVTCSHNKSSLDASKVVVRELLALGFDSSLSLRTENTDSPLIKITVNVRPKGPQGMAKLRKQLHK